MKKELLRVENAYGCFAGRAVLNYFIFDIYENETVCLFGRNNCGKSTFLRMLEGTLPGKWEKEIYFRGKNVRLDNRDDAQKIGIYCIHETPSLIEDMSLAENLNILGLDRMCQIYYDWKKIEEKTQKILDLFGVVDAKASDMVSEFSRTDQFLLEMVRAVGMNSKVVVLDCVESFDRPEDQEKLGRALKRLNELGIAAVYSHNKADERIDMADRMIIMRNGMRVKTVEKSDFQRELISQYAGETAAQGDEMRELEKRQDVVLRVDGYKIGTRSVSFDIMAGECIGVCFAADGYLQQWISDFLSGTVCAETVELFGEKVLQKELSSALRAAVYVVPDLDSKNILFPNMNAEENILINLWNPGKTPFHIRTQKLQRVVKEEESRVIEETAQVLGQEQILSPVQIMKILGARVRLARKPVLILGEPLLNLDSQSAAYMCDVIRKITKYGIAVICLAKRTTELNDICTKIIRV